MSSSAFNPTSSRFRNFCHTNDGHQIPHLDGRTDHIPNHDNNAMDAASLSPQHGQDSVLQCCCGRPGCAYLEHNNAALGDIEKDLEKAARLGQALLTRHESYITESQIEHARLNAQIADLEADRNSLQVANEKMVAENRDLLHKLETLNTAYTNSDDQVKNLEALLRDCEVEVRRLHGLARRAEELEGRVLEMDRQNVTLSRRITDGEQETRSTLLRWRDSERKLKGLEIEVQKIEYEARQERERHEEVVARLERERVLGGAEGRLKGAAAAQGIGTNGGNSNVVSHFVRDILHDNANLQAGIVELRELLQTSNEEVQNLRSQILQHQPMGVGEVENAAHTVQPLDEELSWNEPQSPQVQREVHVHHHYHAKLAPKRERTSSSVRRSSRKRVLMASGILVSTPESSVPSTPISRPQRLMSSPVIPMSLNHHHAKQNRWSAHSAITISSTASSLPSSPRSHHERYGSIFDRVEFGEDSSRPTSPESATGLVSPGRDERCRKLSKGDFRLDTFEEILEDDGEPTLCLSPEAAPNDVLERYPPKDEPLEEQSTSSDNLTPKLSDHLSPPQPIDMITPLRPPDPTNRPGVKPEELPTQVISETATTAHSPLPTETAFTLPPIRPSLQRSTSHESLLSISGMDIHIHNQRTKRPTQSPFTLLRAGNAAHFARSPSTTRAASAASQPVASVTEYTAIYSGMGSDATRRNRSNPTAGLGHSGPTSMSVEALSGIVGIPPQVPREGDTQAQQAPSSTGLGRLVGGWVRGKWGLAPVKSVGDLRAQRLAQSPAEAQSPPPVPELPPTQTQTPLTVKRNGSLPPLLKSPDSLSASIMGGRRAGINQKGAIPGFWVPTRAPSELHPKVIDEDALKEILAE